MGRNKKNQSSCQETRENLNSFVKKVIEEKIKRDNEKSR